MMAMRCTRVSSLSKEVSSPSSVPSARWASVASRLRAQASSRRCFSTGKVWPEQLTTTTSSGLTRPVLTILKRPAKARPAAGSMEMPSILAMTCMARKASSSLTASNVPPCCKITSRK